HWRSGQSVYGDFFFHAEDGIRDFHVTGVQTCALPIYRVPYRVWIAEGHLETTPGRAISKLHVLRRLQTICAYFDVRKIGYDRWRIEDLKQLMIEHDIQLPELEPFGQGYQSMGPAVDEFERRLLGLPSQVQDADRS